MKHVSAENGRAVVGGVEVRGMWIIPEGRQELKIFQVNQINIHIHTLTYLVINLLTPNSRVVLEKLTDSQPVKKFPAFYGTKSPLPHSQVPATFPYSEPAQSSPYSHILLPEYQS